MLWSNEDHFFSPWILCKWAKAYTEATEIRSHTVGFRCVYVALHCRPPSVAFALHIYGPLPLEQRFSVQNFCCLCSILIFRAYNNVDFYGIEKVEMEIKCPFSFKGVNIIIRWNLTFPFFIPSCLLTNLEICCIVAFKVPHSTSLPHCNRFSVCRAARARRLQGCTCLADLKPSWIIVNYIRSQIQQQKSS